MSTIRLEDDFYQYVNEIWLENTTIPEDKPSIASFSQLSEAIDVLLLKDFDEMLANTKSIPNKKLAEFIAYYRLTSDFTRREKEGIAPALPYLERIEKLSTLKEWQEQAKEWILEGLPTPFSLEIETDMKNARINTLYVSSPGLILPDKTYYEENNENGTQLLAAYQKMLHQLLLLFGKTEKEADEIVKDALAFDQLMAPHTKSAEEASEVTAIYNPQSFDTFVDCSKQIDFNTLIPSLVGGRPEEIIVTEPEYFEALDQIVQPANFPLLKHWMIARAVYTFSTQLTEECRQIRFSYEQALSGSKEITPQKKAAFYFATGMFDQVIGQYYGETYFGKEAKEDVEQMVKKMITVYETRLEKNEWLQKETREKAIVKLNTLGVHVGYPEKIMPIYDQFSVTNVDDSYAFFSHTRHFIYLSNTYQYSLWNQPVEPDIWEMSAHTVNAYYHPQLNVIVFPAAILQEPFYSLKQSKSANYGGIGAVIAHEISHAFDNNGALFDEFGNMNNWWSEADLAHFKQLAQDMINQFDGLPFSEGTVNGTLTVSENIADAGGLSCALAAAKQEANIDLSEFFTNWARIWRNKSSLAYQELLLAIDVHAPAKLRANIQPRNLDDFYTTFHITETDEMYLAPDKRITIW